MLPQINIGETIRNYRLQKGMSQGDIEKRTGLLRCYISRVENGHTVPSLETLEKFSNAFDVPLYQIFYDGEKPPALKAPTEKGWDDHGARIATCLRKIPGAGRCCSGARMESLRSSRSRATTCHCG